VPYINICYLNKFAFISEQDKEQFKIYELESLFVHLANELFKKRKDRNMDLIPVYAHKIFENYTYRFDKGFECHVSIVLLFSDIIKFLHIFFILSFCNI